MAPGPVETAVDRDLARVAASSPDLASGGLGAMAKAIAAQIDNPKASPTSKSMLSRVLLDTLVKLFDMAPEEVRSDGIDELVKARAKRKARRA